MLTFVQISLNMKTKQNTNIHFFVNLLSKIIKDLPIILLLVIFFNAMAQMITVVSSMFLNDVGFSVYHIGLILTFFGIGSFIGGYAGGHLSDKISTLKIIKFSLFGNALATLIFPYTKDIILLSIFMAIIGFFNNTLRPASIILLLKSSKTMSEVKLLSYRRVALNLGFSIGAMIVSFVYSKNIYLPFIILSVILAIGFILSIYLKDEPENIKTKEELHKHNTHNFNAFMFYMLNIIMIISLIILNQNQITYVIYLDNIAKLSIKEISLLFAISGVIIAVFQIPLGHIIEKLSYQLACFIGIVFISVGIGMTSIIDNYQLAILSCVFWTLGEMIFYPVILVYIIKMSNYKEGKTMGLYQAFFSSGVLLAPLFGSMLYKISPIMLWNTSLIIGAICAIVFLILKTMRVSSYS